MPQWAVSMRVEKDETWTVEADSEDEALAKAAACDTVDEQPNGLVNWRALSAKEDA